MTNLEVRSFLPIFFSSFPFNRLSPEACRHIASKLTLNDFQPGQVIFAEGELPIAVHCVVQGQIRIVSSTQPQQVTIARLETGQTFGWEGLLRRVRVGSVRSAGLDETLTLSLSADEFEQLLSAELMPVVNECVSAIELYDVLSRFFAALPVQVNRPDLSRVIQTIIEQNFAITYQPQMLETLSSGYVWFVSSGNLQPIGTLIQTTEDFSAIYTNLSPTRLIGIDRAFLNSILEADPLSHTSTSTVIDRLERLLTPSQSLPTPLLLERKSYPAHRSQSSKLSEYWVMTFWNLCESLQIPYRPDILRCWYTRLEKLSDQRMLRYVRIAEAFGLQAQVTRFSPTAKGLLRLQMPALLVLNGIPCVLYEATSTSVTIASPIDGLLHLEPEQVTEQLAIAENSSGIQLSYALIARRHADSPMQQFGWRWFLPYFKPHQGILLQVLFASMVVQLLGLANPLMTQQIIDKVIINSNPRALPVFGGLLVVVTAAESVLTVLRTYLLNSTTNRVDLVVGTEIVRHLLNLPLPFFQKRPVGELAVRISELETIRQFLTGTSITVALDVIFSLLYVGVMWLYSPFLTLCVLGFVPLIALLTLFASPILDRLIRKRSDQHARMQSYLIEVLNSIFTVKAQYIESLAQAHWRDRYLQYLGSSLRTTIAGSVFQAMSAFINNLSSLVVLWIGGSLVLNGELTLGGLIAFRIISGYVTSPLIRLSHLGQRVQEANLSIELLSDIKNTAAEFSPEDAERVALPEIIGRVQYQTIGFGFNSQQQQLVNINFDVAPGAFVGIVGQSGSGKSTLVKLLTRLYSPTQGLIYIDGIDISKISLASLRRQIGTVPQEPGLFEGTIRDNITLFSDADDRAVVEAAKVAEAHDFIMELPDGYSARVEERGASLSGGQRQRITIARMVLSNPRLVILDEATSALDYETERRVVENLMNRFRNTTVFFITHRLANLRHADLILYLQSGVLMEQGTHVELMAKRQLYYCLYTRQVQESS
ncbi:cyclic nucleotide-regulated ABC bacteriocin/lantibiotic exporter (plasmid) [Leptolyngbya boryana NIES-2135]|jgi:subfamily B ATP-binding cassette protein HlyB/CyaB|uniref:Cyclic nucleotide-regulated ABC bacteriocin/lantibiotic exporter n=1 Tax=Leptolyngbya boryana NIES-2135 TaxID=1973484 RepID=A0A1Z4JSW9_LEPBY|nr:MULTISPECIES: peptidase domain-containing ABC transporter [Leptolyngbya]BAY59875.1 cyclic nucleotide-regulated ABC bacteriocin/lantibiotic exporter [Leptolyngbya boryana NIES-2135]MBD2369573.1 peptidase domain-containing ABC transporter [Leptolyngbya sp. FACHB-161]MBD2375982.1 peptidase domain-containing ABC transporter [Leptolyngbya sp. FACHB-238]MBD2400258.1 peptidase domain-containing ABC transporter [Leptolyngbya sp. FACHB-239]MBD2406800.1 peptidase domain-containing ABC transporter [Le